MKNPQMNNNNNSYNNDLGNKRTSGDHQKYSIIKIGQNTKKSPGDSRRLALTQTPGKDHQLMLIRKTQEVDNNNNNNIIININN